MMKLLRRNPGWSAFFGVTASLLVFALSGLYLFRLFELDDGGREALDPTDSAPPAAHPGPSDGSTDGAAGTPSEGPSATRSGSNAGDVETIAEVIDSQWLRVTAKKTQIPERVLRSYVAAASWSTREHEKCNLPWNTLAAIGSVESDHGRFNGAEVMPDGHLRGEILGAQLNGLHTARIPDTDRGAIDGDKNFDRAVGPMQFIPSTWKAYNVDGNGDGKTDPNHIDDATATAASYLCAQKRDLSNQDAWIEAIRGYNPSDEYVGLVSERATAIARSAGPTSEAHTGATEPPENSSTPTTPYSPGGSAETG